MIQELTILGYRGFETAQTLKLAIPNGKPGSGLTVLVGPNGGGKSTVFEAFRKLVQPNEVTFTTGKRNKRGGDRVEIVLRWDGGAATIASVAAGSSESRRTGSRPVPKIYPLASRRLFNPYFNRNAVDRDTYVVNAGDPALRTQWSAQFSSRLFALHDSYSEFSEIFDRVYGRKLEWTIDQQDDGNHFVKVTRSDGGVHTSDGLGEGVVSLLFIIEALFKSADELVVIDEPELSLHPQLQRRLLNEILSFSATRQIVIATHSPELTSVESIVNGGSLARVADGAQGSRIHQLGDGSRETFAALSQDLHFPHGVGYDAVACFFAEDRMIIAEGQEDVVLLGKAVRDLKLPFSLPFWGYGAGGAGKIPKIARILKELGFGRIGAVFDADKKDDFDQFGGEFPNAGRWLLPTEDVRDKVVDGKLVKTGVFDRHKALKPEFEEQLKTMFEDMNATLDRLDRTASNVSAATPVASESAS